MPLEYITTREISDKDGNVKGKIRILKKQEDAGAMVELTCPACGATEKRIENWAAPFVNGTGSGQYFLLKCGKCNFNVKLLKLKKEAAKKKK